jgi:hypothetical protein
MSQKTRKKKPKPDGRLLVCSSNGAEGFKSGAHCGVLVYAIGWRYSQAEPIILHFLWDSIGSIIVFKVQYLIPLINGQLVR